MAHRVWLCNEEGFKPFFFLSGGTTQEEVEIACKNILSKDKHTLDYIFQIKDAKKQKKEHLELFQDQSNRRRGKGFLLTDTVIFPRLFYVSNGFLFEGEVMKDAKRKITDMTVDELKDVIHEAIAEDMEIWRETFEIMADAKLMAQIRQVDLDRAADNKDAFVAWDDLKNV